MDPPSIKGHFFVGHFDWIDKGTIALPTSNEIHCPRSFSINECNHLHLHIILYYVKLVNKKKKRKKKEKEI